MKKLPIEYPSILKRLGYKKDVVKLLKTSIPTLDMKLYDPSLWKIGELQTIAKLAHTDLLEVMRGLGITIGDESEKKEFAEKVGEYVLEALKRTTFGEVRGG